MLLTRLYFTVLVIKLQPHVGQHGQANGSQSVSVRLFFRFTVSLVLSTWSFLSNLCIELGSTLLPLSAVVCLVRVSVFVVLGHASCSPLSESPFVLTYGDWMRNFVLAKSGWVFDTGLLPVVFCPHARKIVKSGWQVARALYPQQGKLNALRKLQAALAEAAAICMEGKENCKTQCHARYGTGIYTYH